VPITRPFRNRAPPPNPPSPPGSASCPRQGNQPPASNRPRPKARWPDPLGAAAGLGRARRRVTCRAPYPAGWTARAGTPNIGSRQPQSRDRSRWHLRLRSVGFEPVRSSTKETGTMKLRNLGFALMAFTAGSTIVLSASAAGAATTRPHPLHVITGTKTPPVAPAAPTPPCLACRTATRW